MKKRCCPATVSVSLLLFVLYSLAVAAGDYSGTTTTNMEAGSSIVSSVPLPERHLNPVRSVPNNLIRNPSLEKIALSTNPRWWQPFITDYDMTSTRISHTGLRSLQFIASTGMWAGCGQLVHLQQTVRTDLRVGTWTRLSLYSGYFAIYADIRYTDGTADLDQTMVLGKSTQKKWEHKSMVLRARKPVDSVMVYAILDGSQAQGFAYLDDIYLVESEHTHPLLDPVSSGIFLSPSRGSQHSQFWCRDSGVCHTDHSPLHMHNYFLAASAQPAASDITLVTQLSADRLERILQLVRVWRGPVSAALYVGGNTFDGIRRVISLWQTSKLVRTHVDIHLVSVDAQETVGPYPINALRNLAWEYARTEQLFLLDVDFMPNPGMREYCEKLWPRIRRVKGLEKAVYIVPGFEAKYKPLVKWPMSRSHVKMLVDAGKLKAVHADKLQSAHAAVNYERWYKTKNPYQVIYDLYFEPYLLVSKDTPRYDHRFSGYGHDKSSHTFQLFMEGYKFVVLPDAFVVHIDHGVPKWRNSANKTRIWVNWYSFALEQEARHGGAAKTPLFLTRLDGGAELPDRRPWRRSNIASGRCGRESTRLVTAPEGCDCDPV